MSLMVKGKAAHIAPRRRPSQGSQGRAIEQSSRIASVETTDHEANEISNLADQYAQSLQQHIQLLQIENSFLKQQTTKNEREKEERMRNLQMEEQYRLGKLGQQEQKRFEEQERKETLRKEQKRRGTTTQILARGNEVSLNGETWCQLPPYHPPIPAIISDRSQYSHKGARERSFLSDQYSRDRREYSVPCVPRSRQHGSIRERSFAMSQNLEREESLLQDLEDAVERNTRLEREIILVKDREIDHEKVITTLTETISEIETKKREEVNVLINEKKSLLEELLHMQKRIDELAPACAEKELKIVSTDNEKVDLTKRLRTATSEISHLQADLKHLREDHTVKDNKIKTLNDEINHLTSRILVIEGEGRQLREKDSENQDKILSYVQQAREFELTKINDKKLVDKVMEENAALIKENAKISTKLSRLEHADFSAKQREMKEAQASIETVSELRTALQTERAHTHSLLNKIDIYKQRCEDLEKSMTDRDKSEDENIKERNRVEKELNALHALSKSLSSENKVLREEKLGNEEIIDELKGKIRALEASIRSAQGIYQEKEKQSAAKIMEMEEEASMKHQKYLEFEEISKTLQQITSMLPSKASSMTQHSHSDCGKK